MLRPNLDSQTHNHHMPTGQTNSTKIPEFLTRPTLTRPNITRSISDRKSDNTNIRPLVEKTPPLDNTELDSLID